MRSDAATILRHMGYALDRDFITVQRDTGVQIKWLSDTPQPDEKAIDAAALPALRAILWELIKTERDRRIQEQGYVAGGKRFHGDTFSRTQQMGLVMLGAGIPPGLQWKTMDGSFITMTPTLAQQIFAAAAASDIALFGHAEALRAQVNAAEDPSSVDITAGWPA